MTGEDIFRKFKKLIPKESFFSRLDSLAKKYRLFGPVNIKNQTAFREIHTSKELFMEYKSTMLSPGKLFIFRPKEELFRFHKNEGIKIEELPPVSEQQIIIGVHPCDTNAILYLDRTFMGIYKDPYYEARRKNTMIISLNCTNVSPNCFCSSVGSGPFLKAEKGYDMLLTDFGDRYLMEIKSKRAEELFNMKGKKAGKEEMEIKRDIENSVLEAFTKTIAVEGLDELFLRNMDHPVWQHTAEERCLSCSNCVLVCPTCFCYDLIDESSMDMKMTRRIRQLDACQDMRFAEVYGGNFRQRRAARLRQFVTHKLNQTVQYGVYGTVGCGRCITWCPTGIDLTEMAIEIRRSEKDM
ncbi:MAG: 4Fe-4S dicluster domain-containing protein [Nitrospirae bacterium]|nr:4Fe-4S dicluster domain-containing protein [Nitrospirota bacterium]